MDMSVISIESLAINFSQKLTSRGFYKGSLRHFNPYQSSGEGVIIQNKNVIDGFTGLQIPSLLPLTSIQLYLYPTKRAEQKLSKNKRFIENNNVIGFKQNSLNEFNNFIQNRKKRLGLD